MLDVFSSFLFLLPAWAIVIFVVETYWLMNHMNNDPTENVINSHILFLLLRKYIGKIKASDTWYIGPLFFCYLKMNKDKSYQSAGWIAASFNSLLKHNLQNIHLISCCLPMAEYLQHMYGPGKTAEKLRSTVHSLWMQWMALYIWAWHVYVELLKQLGLFWNGSLQICWVSMNRPSMYSLRAASFLIGKPGHNQRHSSTEKVTIQQTLEHT